MNTEKLFSELADLGVCASGRRLWRQSRKDVDMIIKVWKKWPEYWVEHSEGALAIVRKYFNLDTDLDRLASCNLFLDHTQDVELDSDTAVFFVGNSNCTVRVKDWATVKIYCFNHANIRLKCGAHSYVNIEAYDHSQVSILSNKGKCKIYAYDQSQIKDNGNPVSIARKDITRGSVFNGEEVK